MKKNNVISNKEKQSSGFRLEIFNFIIIIFTVAVTVALSAIIFNSHSTYNAFYDATEEYISCRMSAEQVQDASDYLTNQVRAYILTGNQSHIDNYFVEANVSKRREKAIKAIKQYVSDKDKDVYLENAVSFSKELMKIEYYSMRLRLDAGGVSSHEYPKVIRDIELKPEDAALPAEAKIEKAKDLVQNSEYSEYKDKIYENISLYTRDLLNDTRKSERENSVLFSKYQQIQLILIVVLICILMVTVAFTTIFLIRPLRKSSKLIVEQNSLPIKGTMEMRTFAMLYNKVLEKTKTQHAKLSYEASHDSLTGVHNRSVFDEMYRSMHQTGDIGLALVDIDAFKEINDTYGHEIGDNVLKKVASLLHASFRSGDIICRIGGDEFTVILNGINESQKEQLQNKFEFVCNKLKEQKDSLPSFTLSIGVAFGSEKTSFKTLYKNADLTLYDIKASTKNGIGFYEK